MSKKSKQVIESFTISKDEGISVNAALIIIIPGFLMLWFTIYSNVNLLLTPNIVIEFNNLAIRGFYPLFQSIGIILFYISTGLIVPGLVGWFVGGILSAVVYGKEGSNSPLHSAILMLKIFGPVTVFVLISRALTLSISFDSSDILSNIAISTVFFITLALPLLAIPILIMGSLGYKFGLILSS